MNEELQLQAGGTLNSRRHLYIERREDEKFFELLEQAEYVNVLSSRQMGKSSLMMRAVQRLSEKGIKSVTIDLAAELGTPPNLDVFCLGLLSKIARVLELQLDLKSWWERHDTETVNQRLMRFFRDVVGQVATQPVVIFLDEIDSTLKLSYTDDLFTAIRGMYNDRPIVEVYRRITFCLLGVATPNELIQDRRTTAYNVGTPLTLRDFDRKVDNLSPFTAVLNPTEKVASRLLDRILHWSGGQPYLTQKFCLDVMERRIDDVDAFDRFVTQAYENLGQAGSDVHFQQILRFLEDRLSDGAATIDLYARVLNGEKVPDRTTLASAELKLSGLVKRDNSGNLVVRNPIYCRLFDNVWVQRTRPKRALSRARNFAIAASVAFLLLLGGGVVYYVTVVQPNQIQLERLEQLAALKISITDGTAGGLRATFPNGATPDLIRSAVPILKQLDRPVTEIGQDDPARVARDLDNRPIFGFRGEMTDLSPIGELNQLRLLDIRGLKISNIDPLARLSLLTELQIGYARFNWERDRIPLTSIAALQKLKSLTELTIGNADISDLAPLETLAQLRKLDISRTKVSDLRPLAKIQQLEILYAADTPLQSLEPLSGNTSLFMLDLQGTKVSNFSPLSGISNLSTLDATNTSIADLSVLSGLIDLKYLYLDGTQVSDLKPLINLANLRILWLEGTQVMDVTPLAHLTNLTDLNLSDTQVRDVQPLQSLRYLEILNLRRTKVPPEQLSALRKILNKTSITPGDPGRPNPSLPR
nr:AAA-like domain-containing protein [Bradyrhizobium lablabi]